MTSTPNNKLNLVSSTPTKCSESSPVSQVSTNNFASVAANSTAKMCKLHFYRRNFYGIQGVTGGSKEMLKKRGKLEFYKNFSLLNNFWLGNGLSQNKKIDHPYLIF